MVTNAFVQYNGVFLPYQYILQVTQALVFVWFDGTIILYYYYPLKAVVNTVGGLLASRRVFCWLPLGVFCSYSTNSD